MNQQHQLFNIFFMSHIKCILLLSLLAFAVERGFTTPPPRLNMLQMLMHTHFVAEADSNGINALSQNPRSIRNLSILYVSPGCDTSKIRLYLGRTYQVAFQNMNRLAPGISAFYIAGDSSCPDGNITLDTENSVLYGFPAEADTLEDWLIRGLNVVKSRDTAAMWHWVLDGVTSSSPTVREESLYILHVAGWQPWRRDRRFPPEVPSLRTFPAYRATGLQSILDTLRRKPAMLFSDSCDFFGIYLLMKQIPLQGWQTWYRKQAIRHYAIADSFLRSPNTGPVDLLHHRQWSVREAGFAQLLISQAFDSATIEEKKLLAPLLIQGYTYIIKLKYKISSITQVDYHIAVSLVKYTQNQELRAASKAFFDHPKAKTGIPYDEHLRLQQAYYEAACRAVGIAP